MSLPISEPESSPRPALSETRPPALPAQAEEGDVWWGSCSGRTLLPSTLVCLALTVGIGLGAWTQLPRGWMQFAFLALGGVVWLLQGLRWAYRYFTFNYRLTSRRVFRDKGFIHPEFCQVALTEVVSVEVQRTGIERLVNIGRIVLHLDAGRPPLVLEGVRYPDDVADLMRAYLPARQA